MEPLPARGTLRRAEERFSGGRVNGDRAASALVARVAVEPSVASTEGCSSRVEFVLEDVACRIELVAADRRRKLAAYDMVLANKRPVDLTCRLYGIEQKERTTNLALFDTAANSLGRSRFFVPLGRRSRYERVFIEISGEDTALLFETRLPPAAVVAPVGRAGFIGMAFGTFALAIVLLLVVMHATQPAPVVSRAQTRSLAFTAPKAPLEPPLAGSAVPLGYVPIDDGVGSTDTGFKYVGAWQHVKNLRDGRSNGTSSRTYHAGDRAEFTFDGERFKVFGIKGPTGGYAELSVDGDPRALLLFYAPKKQLGAQMYASGVLPRGKHVVRLLVIDVLHGAAKRRYVNIDGAAYLGR